MSPRESTPWTWRLHAGEHRSLSIAYADVGGLVAVFRLCNVEIAVLAAGDVVRPAHAGPHVEEVAVGREYLGALVRSIGHVELAVRTIAMLYCRWNWSSALPGTPHDLTRKRQQLAPLCGASC
jgi:hypothetical protein